MYSMNIDEQGTISNTGKNKQNIQEFTTATGDYYAALCATAQRK